MKRPRIQRVPAGYQPGYPAHLDRATYDALLVPDQQARIAAAAAAAAAAASVALGAGLAAQDPGRPDGDRGPRGEREARVLRVLERAATGSAMWLGEASFRRGTDERGVPHVLPYIPISFGNSHNGVFDAERARALARELFAAYDLAPEVDYELRADGVAARLDVYDPKARVGCKLRGTMPEPNNMLATPGTEEPERALDDAELRQLAASGHRIQALDLEAFPLMDGDQVTPTLAYLAGIVELLNSVTGGPDIDLDALLQRHEVRLRLPAPAGGAEGVEVVRSEGQPAFSLRVERPAEVAFTLQPAGGYERRKPPEPGSVAWEWKPAAAPAPAQRPVLLRVPGSPAAPLTVTQAEARPPLRLETSGAVLFLPGGFDPRTPFTVTLRLQPGTYWLEGYVVLAGFAP